MLKVHVEIWSDIVCPWCGIGRRKFEAAARTFEGRADITVRHRSFELDPDGPERGRYSVPEYMQEALGMPMHRALLGGRGGLDEADVRTMLDSGGFTDAVRRDESEARRAGIHGVPAFRFNGRTVVSGALSVAQLQSIIAGELAAPTGR